jgi:GTP-binding protein HflX
LIGGNTEGVKKTVLAELEKLYDIRTHRSEFASTELLEALADLSGRLEREISVYVTRGGIVKDVSLGSANYVELPYLRVKRGLESLSGIRCIHTHPDGTEYLSSVDIGTLVSSRLDAMAALAVRNGHAGSLSISFIGEELTSTADFGPYPASRIPQRLLMQKLAETDRKVKELIAVKETEGFREKAILVGVNASEESMEELGRLADTAGAEIVGREVQNRPRTDAKYYVGKGMANDLALMVSSLNADMIITDDELDAITVKNLENMTGVKVIDRTSLILDIFAKRAMTREGSLQVELAQLKYNLPRLRGEATYLSRLGGGIGTRGPGEKKLEVDRRRIKRRIYELENEIEKIAGQRDLRRETRRDTGIPVVALAGYTNAGKSTLLNALSGSDVFAEDKLFATLDTVTRKVKLPSGREALFTDTVGFIEKLPHELVSAFKSTLEEVKYADLILHVVDLANPAHELQESVVEDVLCSLGAGDKRVIKVYNKADLTGFSQDVNGVLFISARTRSGLDALLATVDAVLKPRLRPFSLVIPYARGDVLSFINRNAEKVAIDYTETGVGISGEAEERHIRAIDALMRGKK